MCMLPGGEGRSGRSDIHKQKELPDAVQAVAPLGCLETSCWLGSLRLSGCDRSRAHRRRACRVGASIAWWCSHAARRREPL